MSFLLSIGLLYDTQLLNGTQQVLFPAAGQFCSFFETLQGFSQCMDRSEWYPSQNKGSIVYLSIENILEADLLEYFDILIIGSIVQGQQDAIAALFGETGSNILNNYTQGGGMILASGQGTSFLGLGGLEGKE